MLTTLGRGLHSAARKTNNAIPGFFQLTKNYHPQSPLSETAPQQRLIRMASLFK